MTDVMWLEDAPGRATYFAYDDGTDEAEWIIEWFVDIPPSLSCKAEELLTEIDCNQCNYCGHGVGMLLSGENDEYTLWEPCGIVNEVLSKHYICDECYYKEYGND